MHSFLGFTESNKKYYLDKKIAQQNEAVSVIVAVVVLLHYDVYIRVFERGLELSYP